MMTHKIDLLEWENLPDFFLLSVAQTGSCGSERIHVRVQC